MTDDPHPGSRVWLVVAAAAAAVAIAAAGLWLAGAGRYEAIRGRPGDRAGTRLPAGTVVLNAAAAEERLAPFVLRGDARAASGRILAIPEATGTAACVGSARLPFGVAETGIYRLWVRVHWRDSCANSVSVSIDDSTPLVVGQDAVYETWHWMDAGDWDLSAGTHALVLREREDGIGVDQFLLTPDRDFVPTGPVTAGLMGGGRRRFADSFDRSPGHGSPAWHFMSGTWDIAFSLDPNRIPDQYSLSADATDGQAVALIRGVPWKGWRLTFSVHAAGAARFGTVLTDGPETLEETEWTLADSSTGFRFRSRGSEGGTPGADEVIPGMAFGQWHRIVVERWAWIVRVYLNGILVFARTDVAPLVGVPGLAVSAGEALFDDVRVVELPWQAEDGRDLRIAWRTGEASRWYRRTGEVRGLAGKSGWIAASWPGLPVREVFVDSSTPIDDLRASGMKVTSAADASAFFLQPSDPAAAPAEVRFDAVRTCRLSRVAVRYGVDAEDRFRFGPYHFTERTVPDPSDYVDFTPEEQEAMERSAEAEKLRRKPKQMALVGESGDHAVWSSAEGGWSVQDGVLRGTDRRGSGTRVRFWQELECPIEMRFRLKLSDSRTTASVRLAETKEGGGVEVIFGANTPATEKGPLFCRLEPATAWHEVVLRLRAGSLEARVDDGERGTISRDPEGGGGILLGVANGTALVDDIEFEVVREEKDPASGRSSRFYAFDRRETHWLREGGPWIDHGGISCAIASHWISLHAHNGSGTLLNRNTVSGNVLLATNIEENSEWFGWDRNPSHRHYPFDNIQLFLAPSTNLERGYRLEVNSRRRTRTVLYRNGVAVAEVGQGAGFPIQYRGGHAPYRPRRNRIKLIKVGGTVSGYVNGYEVLRYEDPDPLEVSRVAIGGYDTRVNLSRIVVRELAEPGKDRAKRE